jgi:hypothetical protein
MSAASSALTAKPSCNLRELAVKARMNPASIFDLSPAEKLQLVEDLWDDLAAVPEMVPVLDWQKAGTGTQESESGNKPGLGTALGRGKAQYTCPPWPLSC